MCFRLIRAARAFDKICWDSNTLFTIFIHKVDYLVVGSVFEVEQEVRPHPEDPLMWHLLAGHIFVFENDSSSVNGVGIELWAGRNRVIPRLKTRDGGYNDIEWNCPLCGIPRCG